MLLGPLLEELRQFGISVCPNTVARLLDQMGYSLRVNHKQISTSHSPNRNLQFEYLAELRGLFQRRQLPIISGDTKKRELVGNSMGKPLVRPVRLEEV